MMGIDVTALARRLKTFESIALLERVDSTNVVARRVVQECVENDIPLASSIIIAGAQTAGRGRMTRTWYSPEGKGIYATVLQSREPADLGLYPLFAAASLSMFLEETFGLTPRIKWPNDILVDERKLAGILIEARIHDEAAYLITGIGINVLADSNAPSGAVSVADVSRRDSIDVPSATQAFAEFVDRRFSQPIDHDRVLEEWRARSVHKQGDRISCVIGSDTLSGTWGGIDHDGRVLLRQGSETVTISAGDLIMS